MQSKKSIPSCGLVLELTAKIVNGIALTTPEKLEYFCQAYKNKPEEVKELLRKFFNLGPDVATRLINKNIDDDCQVYNSGVKAKYEHANILFVAIAQSILKANRECVIHWNESASLGYIFQYFITMGYKKAKEMLKNFTPSARDIFNIKAIMYYNSPRDTWRYTKKIETVPVGATSYCFGFDKQRYMRAFRKLGIALALNDYIPFKCVQGIDLKQGPTYRKLCLLGYTTLYSKSFPDLISSLDKRCFDKNKKAISIEELLDYLLDISVLGLLLGDKNPLYRINKFSEYLDEFCLMRNKIKNDKAYTKDPRLLIGFEKGIARENSFIYCYNSENHSFNKLAVIPEAL